MRPCSAPARGGLVRVRPPTSQKVWDLGILNMENSLFSCLGIDLNKDTRLRTAVGSLSAALLACRPRPLPALHACLS